MSSIFDRSLRRSDRLLLLDTESVALVYYSD